MTTFKNFPQGLTNGTKLSTSLSTTSGDKMLFSIGGDLYADAGTTFASQGHQGQVWRLTNSNSAPTNAAFPGSGSTLNETSAIAVKMSGLWLTSMPSVLQRIIDVRKYHGALMTELCGAVWPDNRFEGKPVTCHLDKDHGGFWHRWDHENYVKPGKDFGDGMIAWHTELARNLSVGLTPSVVELTEPYYAPNGQRITHEVVPHPRHAMMQNRLPPKPNRGT